MNLTKTLILLMVLCWFVSSYYLFQKLSDFCPDSNLFYSSTHAPSLVTCATYCKMDTTECSRFRFDKMAGKCMMYSNNQTLQTNPNNTYTGGNLYTIVNKHCSKMGYEFDKNTYSCVKVYDIMLQWNESRAHCQNDGGDLVSMTTLPKWNFVTSLINCSLQPFWIGLWNETWLTGESFQNVYGFSNSDIKFDGDSCARLRFGNVKRIRSRPCTFERRFVCELFMTI